jgi:hypothetical protein
MDNQQGPLDKFLQENSIMYKGVDGNAYNTQLDEYYIEKDGYSSQLNQGDNGSGNCSPCYNPNPPWWCSDPSNACYDASVPIDGALPILMLAGFLLAVFSFRSRVMLTSS